MKGESTPPYETKLPENFSDNRTLVRNKRANTLNNGNSSIDDDHVFFEGKKQIPRKEKDSRPDESIAQLTRLHSVLHSLTVVLGNINGVLRGHLDNRKQRQSPGTTF